VQFAVYLVLFLDLF